MKFKVIKRDGREVDYDGDKIVDAIEKAMKSSPPIDTPLAHKIKEEVEKQLKVNEGNKIEDIQRLVERKLMASKRKDVAHSYIEYRHWRDQQREKGELFEFVTDVIDLGNLENENANMDENVFTAKKERIASKILRDHALEYLLSPRVRQYYEENLIYIHDFNSYSIGMHNCLLIDLGEILENGFVTQNGDVRPPKSISSAMQLTAVVLQCVSNEQFGGVSVANLDYDLAPYVKESFKKIYRKNLRFLETGETEEDIISLYGEITMGNKKLGATDNALLNKIYDISIKDIEKETLQGAEGLIHNLNTLQSRSGNQLPFTSINYGTDTSEEGRLISKSILIARMEGVGKNGVTPIFPIGIFKHKRGINAHEGDPNYDLKQLAIESTSKRIYPNFANVDAPHLAKATSKHLEFATMGCRTSMGIDRHGLEGYTGRGNISPITINLPKIALRHSYKLNGETDLEGFFKELEEVLEVGVEALVNRFEWQGKQLSKSAPFLYENQVLKGKKLQPEERVREVIKHGTLAIGYIGLSNCLVALIGKHHGESKEALELGIKIVEIIDRKAKDSSDKYDLNFSAYASPAEGLSHKYAKVLKEEFGEIEGVTDREYINNSHHVPVYYNCSIKEKIDIENNFSKYATGGNITYTELDGNARNNPKALEEIINYAMDTGVPYLALNHPIDECTNCGYEGIIGEECPSCHKKDGEVYIKRLRRVTGYITSSYKEYFNDGKKAEVEDRVKHTNDINDLGNLLES